MNLRAVGKNVIIQIIDKPDTTKSGLVVSVVKIPSNMAMVVGEGSELAVKNSEGYLVPQWVGKKILFNQVANATPVEVNGQVLYVSDVSIILAEVIDNDRPE